MIHNWKSFNTNGGGHRQLLVAAGITYCVKHYPNNKAELTIWTTNGWSQVDSRSYRSAAESGEAIEDLKKFAEFLVTAGAAPVQTAPREKS